MLNIGFNFLSISLQTFFEFNYYYENFQTPAKSLKIYSKTYAMQATQLELESIRWKPNNDTHLHVCMQPTANKSTNELYITA